MPQWAPEDDAIVFLGGNDAYVAPAVGGTARRIAQGGEGDAAVRSASWSPRGDSVAIVRSDSLLVVPREGPGFRYVGRGHQLHGCTWSPDDRWIACVSGNAIGNTPGPLFGNRANSAIVLFAVEGGSAIDLTGHEHQHTSPMWVGERGQLWLLSDRLGGRLEAFVVHVSDRGTMIGEPQRLGLEAEFLSVAGDRVVYSVATRRANIHSLPADPDTLQTLVAARPETRGNQIVEVVRVSQDGRWLLYDSNAQGNSDIFRQPIAGGRAERLTDDAREEFAPDLSPDGRIVAYHRWDEARRRVKFRHLDNGAVTEPFPSLGDQGVPRWSPSGQQLAFWEHGTEPGAVTMLRVDAAGSWSKQWRLDSTQLPAWRLDGRVLGLVRADGAVWAISADSGAVQVLHEPSADSSGVIITFLAWDPQRPLLWMLGHDRRNRNAIWVMPATGGAARRVVDLGEPPGWENGPALATDGARLYFTLEERLSNVRWAALRRP
jgi:Tol biopolymer transport system component